MMPWTSILLTPLRDPVAPTSWEPSVLTRSKHRQRQEAEGGPYLVPPLRRKTKDRLHYSERYESTPICKLGPDPESVTVVEMPTGSGEVVEEGHIATIHEVSAHAVM